MTEIFSYLQICFEGFDASSKLTVSETEPTGETRSVDLGTFEGKATWLITPMPGDAVGRYSFAASQPGGSEATGRYTIAAATGPRATALDPEGPPGTTFRVELAGFVGSVNLYLYRYESAVNKWLFKASLGSVSIGDEGRITVEIPSVPGDPSGLYRVYTVPAAPCDQFESPPCATFEITGS
jgi:hypothetical protein